MLSAGMALLYHFIRGYLNLHCHPACASLRDSRWLSHLSEVQLCSLLAASPLSFIHLFVCTVVLSTTVIDGNIEREDLVPNVQEFRASYERADK